MSGLEFALFDTEIGRCGVAWGAAGIAGVQLPESREVRTRARLGERFPDAREGAPPPAIQGALDAVAALLRGESADLSAVLLDMREVPPFHRRVYHAARGIPAGETASYGDLAGRLGAPRSARAVGQALGRNPFAIIVPCHRVLAAGGKVGGFTANGGITTKLRLLSIESGGQATVAAADASVEGVAVGFDPAVALAEVRSADPVLGRLIDRVGPFRMRLKRTTSLFAALAEAIVYQQLHGRAAATIYARVCALFPHATSGPRPEQILRATEAKLRGAGLSGNKLLSLRDLARKTVDGTLPTLADVQAMSDEQIIEKLTTVRGIGRWTVEMLLMFRLGRPDVLPVDDYGVRKGYAVAFSKREMPAPKALAKLGARWKPHRTLVSWYLWRAAELAPA
jgi:methylated-DNA-[protein]-cysteine S-methyltransferase